MSRGRSDFEQERGVALLSAWRGLMRSGMAAGVALRAVCRERAPRFFISPENAYRRVRRWLRGEGLGSGRSRVGMNAMMRAIVERCAGDYSYRNVERVVYSEAPSFFLSEESVRVLIFRYRKRYGKKGKG